MTQVFNPARAKFEQLFAGKMLSPSKKNPEVRRWQDLSEHDAVRVSHARQKYQLQKRHHFHAEGTHILNPILESGSDHDVLSALNSHRETTGRKHPLERAIPAKWHSYMDKTLEDRYQRAVK